MGKVGEVAILQERGQILDSVKVLKLVMTAVILLSFTSKFHIWLTGGNKSRDSTVIESVGFELRIPQTPAFIRCVRVMFS